LANCRAPLRALTFGALVALAGPARAELLKVIGYNVESSGATSVGPRLAAEPGVDVWGLCEIRASFAPAVRDRAAVSEGAPFELVRGATGNDGRLAIVYNAARLELVRSVELMHVQLSPGIRAPLVAQFRARSSGTEFLFVVNHLHGQPGHQRRHEQAQLLNAWAAQQSLPVIAVGDYNFDYAVTNGDLDHDAGFDFLTANGVFRWVRPAALVKTQNSGHNSVLDFVFASGAAQSWAVDSTIVVLPGDFPDTAATSDHRPVVGRFNLPDPPSPRAAPRARAAAAPPAPAVLLAALDEAGAFEDPGQLAGLTAAVQAAAPTHLFVFAHGWNNSKADSAVSYDQMAGLIDRVAAQDLLRPSGARPVYVGVQWPSKAWDDGPGPRALTPGGDDDWTDTLLAALPAERSPRTYREDVAYLRELLRRPGGVSAAEYDRAVGLLRKYSLPPARAEDRTGLDVPPPAVPPSARAAPPSLADLLRVFTFWQMKKRAGVVGAAGGRDLVASLMTANPGTKVYLVGHSFGCKLWLEAVAGGAALPRPVDGMILLQGAVSAYAMADAVPGSGGPGGYRAARDVARVAGLLVATYSVHDGPLNYAYPAGEFLGFTPGERSLSPASRYSAMGAVGPAGSAAQGVTMHSEPVPYSLGPGVWGIDGSALIGGHGDYKTRHVAWLISAVAYPPAARAAAPRAADRPDAARLAKDAAAFATTVAGADDARLVDLFRAAYAAAASPPQTAEPPSADHRAIPSPAAHPRRAAPVSFDLLRQSRTFVANAARLIRDQPQRIVGGVETTEYPDCVAVGDAFRFDCTGTLIAPDVVVTAGHCYVDGAMRVAIGVDVTRPDKIVPVRKTVRHPDYGGPAGRYRNDLTLLFLAEPVTGVPPRVIATTAQADAARDVLVVGYGTTDADGRFGFGRRRLAVLPVACAGCDGCDASFGCNAGFELVAGRLALGRDSCAGDSGGPIYVSDRANVVVAGATSRAVRGSPHDCGDGGIYVRLDKYQRWIDEQIAANRP
jgi:hypothetical protein